MRRPRLTRQSRVLPDHVPAPSVGPVAVGATTGLVVAYLVAGQAFRTLDVGTDPLRTALLIAAHGLVFGIAAAALVVGRRAGARGVLALSIAALVADPLRLITPWLGIPRIGTLLTVGEISLSAGTVGLATLAVIAAWRVRHRRVAWVVPVRPWVVAGLAAGAVLLFGSREGADASGSLLIAPYAVAVGIGAAAIPMGVYTARRWLTLLGWVAVGALPVMFSAWFLEPPGGWGFYYLGMAGVGLSLLAAVGASLGLLALRVKSPDDRRPTSRVGEGSRAESEPPHVDVEEQPDHREPHDQ